MSEWSPPGLSSPISWLTLLGRLIADPWPHIDLSDPDLPDCWLIDLTLTWFDIQWVSDPLQALPLPFLDWLCWRDWPLTPDLILTSVTPDLPDSWPDWPLTQHWPDLISYEWVLPSRCLFPHFLTDSVSKIDCWPHYELIDLWPSGLLTDWPVNPHLPDWPVTSNWPDWPVTSNWPDLISNEWVLPFRSVFPHFLADTVSEADGWNSSWFRTDYVMNWAIRQQGVLKVYTIQLIIKFGLWTYWTLTNDLILALLIPLGSVHTMSYVMNLSIWQQGVLKVYTIQLIINFELIEFWQTI